jgi:hypothetical protein
MISLIWSNNVGCATMVEDVTILLVRLVCTYFWSQYLKRHSNLHKLAHPVAVELTYCSQTRFAHLFVMLKVSVVWQLTRSTF